MEYNRFKNERNFITKKNNIYKTLFSPKKNILQIIKKKIHSLKNIQHKQNRDNLPVGWFTSTSNRRKIINVFKDQGIKCLFNRVKKDKEGNVPKIPAIRLSWYPKNGEVLTREQFKKKLLNNMPQKERQFKSLRMKKKKLNELERSKTINMRYSYEDDEREQIEFSDEILKKVHKTREKKQKKQEEKPKSVPKPKLRSKSLTAEGAYGHTRTVVKRTSKKSSRGVIVKTKSRKSDNTVKGSSISPEKKEKKSPRKAKSPIKKLGAKNTSKRKPTVTMNKLSDQEKPNNETFDDENAPKNENNKQGFKLNLQNDQNVPENNETDAKKPQISKTEAKLLSMYMTKQVEQSPRVHNDENTKSPLNYNSLIKLCEKEYSKDLKFDTIHVDLPLIVHNITVTKLARVDTEEIRKTKSKEGSTYNNCLILLTTLASVSGDQASLDILQNRFKELVKQENISGNLFFFLFQFIFIFCYFLLFLFFYFNIFLFFKFILIFYFFIFLFFKFFKFIFFFFIFFIFIVYLFLTLKKKGGLLQLFQILGPQSYTVSALKFCSYSVLSPILSSLKAKLGSNAPFQSDKSNRWNININIDPSNKNHLTIHHMRKEISSSSKHKFDFTWNTNFEVLYDPKNSSYPINSLSCSLVAVNLSSVDSVLKRRKINKTIERAFKTSNHKKN